MNIADVRKELKIAVSKSQEVGLLLVDLEKVSGVPEKIGSTGLVTIRADREITWVPLSEIKHVSRVIKMNSPLE